MTGGRTEGEEGEEGVVSGWIAAFVKAAAARRKAERRIDFGELSRVVEVGLHRGLAARPGRAGCGKCLRPGLRHEFAFR